MHAIEMHISLIATIYHIYIHIFIYIYIYTHMYVHMYKYTIYTIYLSGSFRKAHKGLKEEHGRHTGIWLQEHIVV